MCENENELKKDFNRVNLSELFLVKDKLKLDFDICHQQCHRVSQILNKCKVYELKAKFQSLVKQNPDKKDIARKLSGCIINKYN